jgi:hypothetical protein
MRLPRCWQTLGRFVSDLRERGEVLAERGDHGWSVACADDGAPQGRRMSSQVCHRPRGFAVRGVGVVAGRGSP